MKRRQLVVVGLLLGVLAQASIFFQQEPSQDSSLCGEPEAKHAGYLNGLYYVYYETRTHVAPTSAPLVVWLSGGPGCSSLVGMLFENGPCSVGEETPVRVAINEYSWTQAAHVVYIDQPRGTGFSPARNAWRAWTESTAVNDLVDFLVAFYIQYPQLTSNDLYIFGESYAGHYVPDLAHELLHRSSDNTSEQYHLLWQNLKGIGIGNGLTSVEALFSTIGDYATNATFTNNAFRASSKEHADECEEAIKNCQDPSVGGNDDCTRINYCENLMSNILAQVHQKGLNQYNLGTKCYPDTFGLCYRFQPLYSFINSGATMAKLGLPGQSWTPCNLNVFSHHLDKDWYEESEFKVATLLEHNIRVLVYAGDKDIVCNWMAQDLWTRTMSWSGHDEFNSKTIQTYFVNGLAAGEVRSAHGLTFARIFNAGHMVPRDQPVVALAMLRKFTANQPLVS